MILSSFIATENSSVNHFFGLCFSEYFLQKISRYKTFLLTLTLWMGFVLCPILGWAQFAGGTGTEGDPYQVASAVQLDSVRHHLDKHFTQTADINIDTSVYNSGTDWAPIGDNSAKFSGTYDGGGHTISGLYVDGTSTDYIGLFGVISSTAHVKNVAVVNAEVTGKYRVGVIIGKNEGTLSTGYATGMVDAKFNSGGLVGENKGILKNSYANVEVKKALYGKNGGLVGSNESGATITNSYSIGKVYPGNSNFGGLSGSNDGTITNSYWNTETSGQSTSAGGSGLNGMQMRSQTSFSGWDFSTVWAIESGSTVSYPYLRNVEQTPHPGKLAVPFTSGTGTSGDPFKVATAAQLDSVRNFKSAYFTQTADINLDIPAYNSGSGWAPIGDNSAKFSGTYDGGGHTISGLFIDRPSTNYIGLFGVIGSAAKVENVATISANITGNYRAGIITGKNEGTVSTSYATGVADAKYALGGLIGENTGTLENSFANVEVKKAFNSTYGGLVGANQAGAAISNSFSVGKVHPGIGNFGGMIGSNSGSVTNSYWNTETSGLSTSAGGSGLTTLQMADSSQFTGFDFSTIWDIYNKFSFPFIKNTGNAQFSLVKITGTEGWRMLSSPADSITYKALLKSLWTQGFTNADVTNGSSNVYVWDEGKQAFESISDGNQIIPPGTGILVYVYDDQDYDGTGEGFPKTILLNASQTVADISPTISYTSGPSDSVGWNLLGNPYGFTMDWDASSGWAKNNVDASIYIWSDSANSGNGAYLSWNGLTGTLGNGKIAPWQGFWVHANTTSPSISFSDSIRSAGGVYRKQKPTPELRFTLQNNHFTNSAIVMFGPHSKIKNDRFDAYKLQSLSTDFLSLFTQRRDGSPLDINALPASLNEQLDIPMDFSGSNLSGDFTLSWNSSALPTNWRFFLIDNNNEEEIDLTKQSSLSFSLPKTTTVASKKLHLQAPKHAVLTPKRAKTTTSTASRFTLRIVPAGVTVSKQIEANLPQTVQLQQNYPNPFNPVTTIRYAIPTADQVSLEVFDLLGQKVATLINNEHKSAGQYSVRFDASKLSSGLYLYRLKTGNHIVTKKFTLIK